MTEELPVNHEEAFWYASQREEISNLARCYLDANKKLKELEETIKVLRHLADGQRMVQEDLERDLKTLRA